MIQCRIEPTSGKGRVFGAQLLAAVRFDSMVSGSADRVVRPVWAMFASTQQELQPFMANCRMGRAIEYNQKDRLEFLRSTGWLTTWQKEQEGSIATMYHPELFRLDPGMVDPAGIQFVVMAPAYWEAQQKADIAPNIERVVNHLDRMGVQELLNESYDFKDLNPLDLLPLAYLTAAYVDRRTRCPLISDVRFYLQLLLGAITAKIAAFPREDLKAYESGYRSDWGHTPRFGFKSVGLADVKTRALAWDCSHDVFEAFLSHQVGIYLQLTS